MKVRGTHETSKRKDPMITQSIRWMSLAIVAVALTAGSTAWAGACCKATAGSTKAGKTCAACETTECCKKAAAGVEDAKPCEKCAAKAKDKA
jgi:hypothetical protein